MTRLAAGCDYGARRLALAVLDTDAVDLLELHVLDLDRYTEKGVHDLQDDIRSLVGWWGRRIKTRALPMWLETPVAKHLPGGGIGGLDGVIRLSMTIGGLLSVHPGPIFLVRPASWKKEMTGHGGADKVSVQEWLQATCPEISAACNGNEDAVDACCLGLYGATPGARLATSGGLQRDGNRGVLRRGRRRQPA